MLWLLPRIGQASVIQCHFGRGNGELGITIQALQSMRWKKFFRTPTGNFATAMGIEHRSIESGDARDSTFLGEDTFPKILDARPDASDRADPGDDCAPSLHAPRCFPLFSK